jgi:hypothetical protein
MGVLHAILVRNVKLIHLALLLFLLPLGETNTLPGFRKEKKAGSLLVNCPAASISNQCNKLQTGVLSATSQPWDGSWRRPVGWALSFPSMTTVTRASSPGPCLTWGDSNSDHITFSIFIPRTPTPMRFPARIATATSIRDVKLDRLTYSCRGDHGGEIALAMRWASGAYCLPGVACCSGRGSIIPSRPGMHRRMLHEQSGETRSRESENQPAIHVREKLQWAIKKDAWCSNVSWFFLQRFLVA